MMLIGSDTASRAQCVCYSGQVACNQDVLGRGKFRFYDLLQWVSRQPEYLMKWRNVLAILEWDAAQMRLVVRQRMCHCSMNRIAGIFQFIGISLVPCGSLAYHCPHLLDHGPLSEPRAVLREGARLNLRIHLTGHIIRKIIGQ